MNIGYQTQLQAEILNIIIDYKTTGKNGFKILKESIFSPYSKSQRYNSIEADPRNTSDYPTIIKENKNGTLQMSSYISS